MRALPATVLGLVLASCGGPSTAPPQPATGSATPPSIAPDAADASEPERLAAIQRAMNELDEAAQGCWAAAAVIRFDVEGELTAQIDIEPTRAHATIVTDTAHDPQLTACLTQVLGAYRWAPPLHGQTIRIPFRFRAPIGQNTIDRRLVPWNGQARVSLAVLLDELNSGNDAASMLELAIADGGTTELRVASRTELWYFLGPATVVGMRGKPEAVAAGDMVYVASGGAREVRAAGADVHAMVVVIPGGREGAARAGALLTPPVTAVRSALVGPRVLPASAAHRHGPVSIFAEPASTSDRAVAASTLTLAAGTTVPEHVHAAETELLYVLAGTGTLTVAGVQMAIGATSVIQIPPNTRHGFTATTDVRAVQIYTPAGPEQRFKVPAP